VAGRRYLLRVRGLKTNFYTYQGVVKALDEVDLEVREGETLGIVGETGSGKSVTALSVLRLIPQPPGKIEAGEALVNVDEEAVAEIEALRSEVRSALREVFGGTADRSSTHVTLTLLERVEDAVNRSRSMDAAKKQDLLRKVARLRDLLGHHDLLSLSEEDLQDVRGSLISMIFQEPMQALNPVYPVGDQIGESIILHRRRWLARRITLRMRTEMMRRRVIRAVEDAFRDRMNLIAGVDLENPSASDLRIILGALGRESPPDEALVRDVRELLAFEEVIGAGGFARSVYARLLPKGFQAGLYARETTRAAWKAEDVVEELQWLSFVLLEIEGAEIPWAEAKATGPFDVALTPAPGLSQETALTRVRDLIHATHGPAAAWVVLGKVLDPPRVEGDRVVLSVRLPYRKAKPLLAANWLARVPLLGRELLHPEKRMSTDEAAKVLRMLKIGDPERVIHMYPHELSGGMNQRVMIAIALACDPVLLIADEPTTALDVTIQAQILELLRELKRKGRPSLLLITHDLGVIAEMCDRVAVMYGGHVIENAPVREVFKNPLHPYTRGLLKAIPSHTERKERLEVITGSVPNLIYPPSGCRFHPRCPAVMPHCGWDTKDLEPVIRKYAEDLGFGPDAITSVDGKNPFVLRVSFGNGDGASGAMAAVRAKAEADRASSVLLQAIKRIEQEGTDLVVRLIEARRPKDLEVSPGHLVSCYLYEPWPEGA